MRRQILTLVALAVSTAGGAALSTALAGESAVLSDYGTAAPAPAPVPSHAASDSRAGASERARGVAWLLKEQRADGGWSSGNFGTDGRGAASDVATTAWCTLALFRDA